MGYNREFSVLGLQRFAIFVNFYKNNTPNLNIIFVEIDEDSEALQFQNTTLVCGP